MSANHKSRSKMKKLIFIAVISSLLIYFVSCVNLASPTNSPLTDTIIQTTMGQELINLKQALDRGVVTQEGYDELKLKIIEKLDAPVDSTDTN